VVLSIGKLMGAGSARYYENAVASGREDYYSGRGEAEGVWLGAGAAQLGLGGATVAAGSLEALLCDVIDPASGRALGGSASRRSVLGFDLTFSAPKSVSVLYAAGGEELRSAVTAAHEAAVADALGYIEREAVQVRRGAGGALKEHAGGLVAGAYRHRTSRAGDPQLHTHVVAANLALGADGRWTALHGAALYTHAKTGGFLYQAALRDQLSRGLGVEWGPVRNGAAEIAGVPRGALEHFSQRRAEILERMAARGESSSAAAAVAALDTRRAKDYGVVESTIYERWQARAAEHGFGEREVAAVVAGDGQRRAGELDVQAAQRALTGAEGLTAQASTFGRREVLREWAARHSHGAPVTQVELLADRWLQSNLAVRIDGESPRQMLRSEVIATAAGRRVAEIEERYSTPSMLEAETRLLEQANSGRGVSVGVASEAAVDQALAQRPSIRGEQAAMVTQLTRSGDRIDAVRGHAGTGKTFALDAAAQAWRQSGIQVGGVALSGKAADVLGEQTGIATSTIAQLFGDLERYPELALNRGQVLIVDEAGMVGTRDLACLADLVETAKGKLVLIGDDHQLPEIDAGGAFRALAAAQEGVELREVTRQRDPRQIAEVAALRDGRAEQALMSMAQRGAVSTGVTAEQTRELMVHAWHAGHLLAAQDGPAFMVAKRNDDVRDLNQRARALLVDRGELGAQEIWIGARAFREGDRVVAGVNDRQAGVRNGTAGTVWRIDLEGAALSRPRLDSQFFSTVAVEIEAPSGQGVPDEEPARVMRRVVAALQRDLRKQLASEVAATGELHLADDAQLRAERELLRERLGRPPAAAAIALAQIDQTLPDLERRVHAAGERLALDEQRLAQARRGHDRDHARQARNGENTAVNEATQRLAYARAQRALVIARGGDPQQWAKTHQHDLALAIALDEELARRGRLGEQIALQHATLAPSAYTIEAIGLPPQDPLRRGVWNQAAQTIERYRHRNPDLPAHQPGPGPTAVGAVTRHSRHADKRQLQALREQLRDPDRAEQRAASRPDIGPDR